MNIADKIVILIEEVKNNLMRFLKIVIILSLLFVSFIASFPKEVFCGEIIRSEFNSLQESNWVFTNTSGGRCDIISDNSSPDPPNVLRHVFPPGMKSGNSVCMPYFQFPQEQKELYHQFYIKYSSNYMWNSVANKIIYILLGTDHTRPHHSLKIGGDQHLWLEVVGYGNLFPNTNFDPAIEVNRWYKINIHEVLNTPGASNGIFQLSVDDKMVINYSNVPFRPANITNGWGSIKLDTVWGGASGQTTTQEMYIYMDAVIVSTNPIDAKFNLNQIPNAPTNLIIK